MDIRYFTIFIYYKVIFRLKDILYIYDLIYQTRIVDILKISKLKETFAEYIRVKFELFKLDLTEHLSNVLAQLIAYLVILIISGLVVTFLSIALAHFLNSFFQNEAIGYLIVAGIYLLFLLLVFYFLKSGKLKAFFENRLMENISSKSPEENE